MQNSSVQKMRDHLTLKGYAPGTCKLYISTLQRLEQYYNRPAERINTQEVRDYLLYLHNTCRLGNNTMNTIVHAFRFFYNFTGTINDRILRQDIPRCKSQVKLPDVLSPQEVEDLITCTYNLKHRTILMLAYSTGLRAAELVELKIKDIDSKRMLLHVRKGKGGKARYVMLSPKLLKTLREYWGFYKPRDWLFPAVNTGPNKPICKAALRAIFSQAKQRVKITKEGGMHSLRHAFATHLLESGENIFHIQKLLGHARLNTTARYLRMSGKTLTSIKSPLDNLKV
jgi:site-specific recombinase XerD